MKLRLALVVSVAFALYAQPAMAAWVTQYNVNYASDSHNLAVPANVTGHPVKQQFVNNADYVNAVVVAIAGPGCQNDDVIVNLYDGCRNLIAGGGTGLIDTSSVGSGPYGVLIPFHSTDPNGVPVNYGAYYSMDVSSTCASVVLNTDQYNMGRAVKTPFPDNVQYPDKKQDLMFAVEGQTNGSKALDPNPTTNIACSNPAGYWASQCIPVYPENGAGGARNYFNILIRESHSESGWPTATDNSFWLDYTYDNSPPGSINTMLIPEIRKALDQSLSGTIPGVRQTPPYDSWWGSGANPSKMNFYVAVQDPRRDPEALRGFMSCANIDLTIDIEDVPGLDPDYGFYGERRPFHALTQRIGPNTTGWGDGGEMSSGSQRMIWLREAFGSIGNLSDEFFCSIVPPTGNVSNCPLGNNFPYSLNTAPPGCSDPTSSNWCTSYQPVSWLKAQSESNPLDFARQCWSHTIGKECHADPNCYWIAGLPNTAYYAPYQCIPQTVSMYDIGVNCAADASCYLGGSGFAAPNYIDSAQPGDLLMQEGAVTRFVNKRGWTEQLLAHPGFGGALGPMTSTLNCLFAPNGCGAYDSSCPSFVAKWDGGWYGEAASTRNANNQVFMQAGLACQNGVDHRR